MNAPTIRPLGDSALTITLGDRIDPAVNARVHALDRAARAAGLPGLAETVPAYGALTAHYRPEETDFETLARRLLALVPPPGAPPPQDRPAVRVPVAYGGAFGEDLADVARLCGLPEMEVIRLHAAGEYRVYMMGFLPGFAYLGGMDARIAAPRLETPRVRIPAGSVGIAGAQTGCYPLDSPGGWRLIGRTPLRLYDPSRAKPSLLEAGDRVTFALISEAEFRRIEEEGG